MAVGPRIRAEGKLAGKYDPTGRQKICSAVSGAVFFVALGRHFLFLSNPKMDRLMEALMREVTEKTDEDKKEDNNEPNLYRPIAAKFQMLRSRKTRRTSSRLEASLEIQSYIAKVVKQRKAKELPMPKDFPQEVVDHAIKWHKILMEVFVAPSAEAILALLDQHKPLGRRLTYKTQTSYEKAVWRTGLDHIKTFRIQEWQD